MLGRTVSRYRIVAEIGQGGMGVVYKAEDTRLGRPVALKFLPQDVARDSQALERFRLEARAASALNHPHICTIHDIDEFDGQPFIVMELLEGRTLRERIAKKRLELDEVLNLSLQVTEALAAAHAKGIIHRDIKSANIFVTDTGQAKVLDFGLAKLIAEGDSAADTVTADAAPKALITTPGQTMGTIAYMSPEQVRGQDLDARTDIFSFGVVLYEMVTGKLPFPGGTTGVVFDGILNKPPAPLAQTNPSAPAELGHIVDKAIEKDRDLRYQSIREMRADLARLKRDSATGAVSGSASVAVAQPSPKKKRPLVAAVAAATGVFGLAAAAYFLWLRPQATTSEPGRSSLTRVTFEEGLQTFPTWSPDSRAIAYSSNQSGNFDIWVQPIDGGRAVQLTRDPANDWQPVWSPDGKTVAFRSERDGGGIFLAPAGGGPERKLSSIGYWPEWSSDGSRILVVLRPALQQASLVVPHVYVLDPAGGRPPARVLEAELGQFRTVGRIMWHPDSRRLTFNAIKGDINGFWALPIAGGAAVLAEVSDPVQQEMKAQAFTISAVKWAPAGDALYVEGVSRGVRNLWRIDVDPATFRWVSGPVRLTTGAGMDQDISVAPDGNKLAFVTKAEVSRLWSVPFDAKTRHVTGEATPITPANLVVSGFDLSANGKTVVYMSSRPGRTGMELWSASLDGGQPTLLGEALTFFSPRVSKDGTRAAARISRDGLDGRRIAWLTIGRGDERLLPPGPINPMDWSADGEQLVHTCVSPAPPQRPATLCVSKVADPNPEPRLLINDSAYAFWQGRFSPDGRWVLFNAQSLKQAGNSILGIIPVTGGKWIPLTDPTLWADKARWAPDGKAIYFISNRDSAFFDVWGIEFDSGKGAVVGQEFRVTNYANPGRLITGSGGSELGVSANRIVLPIVEATGGIWVLDNIKK